MSSKGAPEFDVYDFDKTIYDGDSSVDFYLFCLRNKPSLLGYLPSQLWHAGLFAAGLEARTKFKGHFFSFLRGVDNPPKQVKLFWEQNYKKIGEWYGESGHSKDVILSASPEFLLRPIARRLDVHTLIATRMNPKTGEIDGQNCRGAEKVRRLREALGEPVIRRAYADSLSDMPVLALAQEKYMVKRGVVTEIKD